MIFVGRVLESGTRRGRIVRRWLGITFFDGNVKWKMLHLGDGSILDPLVDVEGVLWVHWKSLASQSC